MGVGANSAQLSFTGTELYRFEVPQAVMQIFKNWGIKGANFKNF